mmetsp:Transcript_10306/g.30182  ORF Transcript_10306/g.30182 Transcript_10306/m.30182 type:complete len:430 (-) Transcript_10306:424-1713(-)
MFSNRNRTRSYSRSASIVVHDHDVLSGRGVNIAQHPGNERFRSLINTMYNEKYCSDFTTEEKKALALKIIKHIKSLDPPGRFLKRDGVSQSSRGLEGPWEELTEKECLKKATQALRDCNRPDRTGYASQVKAPLDVQETAEERKRSGLSLKNYAASMVEEESKQHKRNSSRKKPPPAAAVSSRKSTKRASRASSPAEDYKKQRLDEPLELISQGRSYRAPPPELPTSTAFADVTVEATPGPPHVAPVPVTQTPAHYRQAFYQPSSSSYGHHHQHQQHHHNQYQQHHHDPYAGTPHPPMMPPSSASYHPGDNDHHQYEAEEESKLVGVDPHLHPHPAPYSPMVRCNPTHHGDDDGEDALGIPMEDDFRTIGTNLFDIGPEDDAFHSMAANAAANLDDGSAEECFDMIHHHDHHHDEGNDNVTNGIFEEST